MLHTLSIASSKTKFVFWYGAVCVFLSPQIALSQTTLTSTLTLTSANNGQTFDNYRISTTSGPCIKMSGVSDVTISNSNIGPCGQNNSDADSNGIEISGGSGNKIYDSYIHVENRAYTSSFSPSASHAGIQGNGTANLTVQGNVVCYGSANVRAFNNGVPSTGWIVTGNYLCNPRGYDGSGNNFQAVDSYGMTVSNNYAFSCMLGGSGTQIMCPSSPAYLYTENQEDSINFYYHSAPPSAAGTVSGNYVVGGHSGSGDGIIADQYADGLRIENNIVVDTAQVGIGFDDGKNNVMTGNQVWMSNPVTMNNTAIAVKEQYSNPCSSDVLTNNVARQVGGSNGSDIWIGTASCVSTNTGNVTGSSAQTSLGLSGQATWATIQGKLPPPLIPPVPKNCTVNSPYTTQTSLPRCPGVGVLPTISAFAANPTTIASGSSTTLSWTTSGALSVSINQGVGIVTGTTSVTVSPTTTITYVLTATNGFGSVTRSVTVTVSSPCGATAAVAPNNTIEKVLSKRTSGRRISG